MAKVGRFSPSSVVQEWPGRANRGAKFSEEKPSLTKEFPHFHSQTSSETQSHGSSDSSESPPYTSYASADSNQYASAFNQGPNKCRQLPCRTFISTGSCPYSEKCVFLHSKEIVSKPVFIKIKVRHLYYLFCLKLKLTDFIVAHNSARAWMIRSLILSSGQPCH